MTGMPELPNRLPGDLSLQPIPLQNGPGFHVAGDEPGGSAGGQVETLEKRDRWLGSRFQRGEDLSLKPGLGGERRDGPVGQWDLVGGGIAEKPGDIQDPRDGKVAASRVGVELETPADLVHPGRLGKGLGAWHGMTVGAEPLDLLPLLGGEISLGFLSPQGGRGEADQCHQHEQVSPETAGSNRRPLASR